MLWVCQHHICLGLLLSAIRMSCKTNRTSVLIWSKTDIIALVGHSNVKRFMGERHPPTMCIQISRAENSIRIDTANCHRIISELYRLVDEEREMSVIADQRMSQIRCCECSFSLFNELCLGRCTIPQKKPFHWMSWVMLMLIWPVPHFSPATNCNAENNILL